MQISIVNQTLCRKRRGHIVNEADDPWDRRQRVNNAPRHFRLAPDWMYDLQITLDGDDGNVDHRALGGKPEQVLAE